MLAGSTTGIEPGTVITLDAEGSDGAPLAWTIVGLVDLRGSPQAMDGATFYVPPALLEELGAETSSVHIASDGTPEVFSTVGNAFPGAPITTGEDAAAAAAEEYLGTSGLLQNVLLGFGAIAVVVAGLVIANTFSVIVASRTRDLALLRTVGATGSQIRASVSLEALIVGAFSAVAGVILGCGAAYGLRAAGEALSLPIPLHTVSLPITAIVVGLLVGIVMSLVAAHAPARAATRVSPLAAFRPLETVRESRRTSVLRIATGLIFLGSGIAALVFAALAENILAGCAGGLLTFLAMVTLANRIVPGTVAGLGSILTRLSGSVGELAVRNASRNPRRTTATAMALLIGVTLTSTIVVGAGLSKVAAADSVNEELPVDVMITSAADTDAQALDTRIAGLEDVAGTALADEQRVSSDAGVHSLYAVDSQFRTALRGGTAVPEPGTALLSSDSGLNDGDILTVGDGRMLIVRLGDPTQIPLMNIADAAPEASESLSLIVRLADDLDGNALREVQDQIATVVDEISPGADITGTAAARAVIDTIIDTMVMIVAGLLSVAILIALIGVGNTMALSVIERRRESALLRVVGLHRGSLRSLLIWEASLIAGAATAIGIGLGIVYGTAGTASVFGLDKVVIGAIPAGQLALIAFAAVAAAVIATLVPARRAVRTSPVEALG
ncbi:ABC transporter permease [Hoyosella altamirensis]|uniref:Putative ABC transport system permease protein n=1 Tax=Hoyosella altamirensis TaxID=616997 RepID=A0A839RH08_9ACTN|nr:FtsX-like permease family protein [Hoyosella altamirensis]MBB3035895.1 putative ABC transport system permease protein [Hoyosella altamirensis]